MQRWGMYLRVDLRFVRQNSEDGLRGLIAKSLLLMGLHLHVNLLDGFRSMPGLICLFIDANAKSILFDCLPNSWQLFNFRRSFETTLSTNQKLLVKKRCCANGKITFSAAARGKGFAGC